VFSLFRQFAYGSLLPPPHLMCDLFHQYERSLEGKDVLTEITPDGTLDDPSDNWHKEHEDHSSEGDDRSFGQLLVSETGSDAVDVPEGVILMITE
jgi:hypothetical protein